MRTLQRLQHYRAPTASEVPNMRRQEAQEVSRRERGVWRARLRRLNVALVVALPLGAAGYWWWGVRIVVDGLVSATPVTLRAPAAAYVAEIFKRPGEACARGEPLLRLEALGHRDERRALELVVERQRLRLALVEGGAELDQADLTRRSERALDARREGQLARAERDVAGARLAELERGREALLVQLDEERRDSAGRVAALAERIGHAESQADAARADADRAAFESQSRGELQRQGVLSREALVSATADLQAARSTVEGWSAEARALATEMDTARGVDALQPDRARTALAEVDARIEVARREVDSAELRWQVWRARADEREELLAGEPASGGELAALELALLRAELAEAEARRAALDERLGNGVLRAPADGVVDRVFVEVGASVDAEAPLVSTFDPQRQWVVAYPGPRDAARIALGRGCRLVPSGAQASLEAAVTSLGATWVACPPELPQRASGPTDLRLPIRIDCPAAERARGLRPNMRVKVVF